MPIPEEFIDIAESRAAHFPGSLEPGGICIKQPDGSEVSVAVLDPGALEADRWLWRNDEGVVTSITSAQAMAVLRSKFLAPMALTPGPTPTPDFSLRANFTLALNQNATLANPINQTAGQSGFIRITNDSVARTLAYGANWKFAGGTPTLTAVASAVDVIRYEVVSAGVIQAELLKDVK